MVKFSVVFTLALLVVMATGAIPGRVGRVRRGYNNSGISYGRGSDERDVSLSGEGGCSGEGGSNRSNYSGSRELASSKYQGHSYSGSASEAGGIGSHNYRGSSGSGSGGRPYAKATATATSPNQNKKNIIKRHIFF